MQGEPNPHLPTNDSSVLPTKRGYASGAISCASTRRVGSRRRPPRSRPETCRSQPEQCQSRPRARAVPAPFGTDGHDRPAEARWLTARARKAVGHPVRAARDPSERTAATSGNRAGGTGRRPRRHPTEPLHRLVGPLALPADHRAPGDEGHDPIHTELGQLLDNPLRAVPLGRGEGHRHRRLGQRGQLYRPDRVQGGTGRSAACVVRPVSVRSCSVPPGAGRPVSVRTVTTRHGPNDRHRPRP